MLDIIEHLAVDYVPGVRALRNLRRSVQSLAKMKREREFLAQKLLPQLSAQLLHRLAPWTSPSVRLVRIGHQGYVMGDLWEGLDAVYAFGDASDCSWQKYFADRSLPVFIHDHRAEKKISANHIRVFIFREQVSVVFLNRVVGRIWGL